MKYLVTFTMILAACFISHAAFGVRTFTQDESSVGEKEQAVSKNDIPQGMVNKQYPRKYDFNKQQGNDMQDVQGTDRAMPEETEEGMTENMQENMQENAREEKMPKEAIQYKKEIQKKEISQEIKTPEPIQSNKPEPKEKVIKPTVTGSGEYKTY